jgi:hypothetical protein
MSESKRTSSNESRSEPPLVEKYFMTFFQKLEDLAADGHGVDKEETKSRGYEQPFSGRVRRLRPLSLALIDLDSLGPHQTHRSLLPPSTQVPHRAKLRLYLHP